MKFFNTYIKYIAPYTCKNCNIKSNDIGRLLANYVDYKTSKEASTGKHIRYYVDLDSLVKYNNSIVQEPTDKEKDQIGDIGIT